MGFIALPTDKLGAQSLVAEVEHGETLQRGVNVGLCEGRFKMLILQLA